MCVGVCEYQNSPYIKHIYNNYYQSIIDILKSNKIKCADDFSLKKLIDLLVI